jgi:4-aminobutyrate aminotransferase/(S)-3-amino-2-methylpropionate transaminase
MKRIPGPRSKRLLYRKKAAVSSAIPSTIPVYVRKARGAIVEDVDGNRFIDFSGGISATNSGHSNPAIVSAVRRQAGLFLHTSFPIAGYESYVSLCEQLNRLAPGKFRKKSVLFNSGAEAVENAVKLARAFTKRAAVVSFEEGFHGRTLLALSLTGKIHPYKSGFGPFAPETYKLHYPYLYRKPEGFDEEHYIDSLLEYLQHDFFKAVVDPESVAAVVMELVAGEGGFIVAPKRYVAELAKICKENGILLVIDEVQTGFCRTGKMFACDHYGISPDLITTAKSISNGLPLSAVTGRADILDCVEKGGLGGTFGGNPLSCEAALAAIKFMEKEKLAERANKIGRVMMDGLGRLRDESSIVGDARGLGAMFAIEIVKDKASKHPEREKTERITESCHRNGLFILSAGVFGNVVRALPPLTIPIGQLEEGMDILSDSVREVDKA